MDPVYDARGLLVRYLDNIDEVLDSGVVVVLPELWKATDRLKELASGTSDVDQRLKELDRRREELEKSPLPMAAEDTPQATLKALKDTHRRKLEIKRINIEYTKIEAETAERIQKLDFYRDAAALISSFRGHLHSARRRFRTIRIRTGLYSVLLFLLALGMAIVLEFAVSRMVFKALLDITIPQPYALYSSIALVVLMFLVAQFVVDPVLQEKKREAYWGLLRRVAGILDEFTESLRELKLPKSDAEQLDQPDN